MQELPSEQAQDLAEYLQKNAEEFVITVHIGRANFDTQALSQIIQNYWDSLL